MIARRKYHQRRLTPFAEYGTPVNLNDIELLDLCGQIALIWYSQGPNGGREKSFPEFARAIEQLTYQTGHSGDLDMNVDTSVEEIAYGKTRQERDYIALCAMYEGLTDQLSPIVNAVDYAEGQAEAWMKFKRLCGNRIDMIANNRGKAGAA